MSEQQVQPLGGKTRPGPDWRTISIKVSPRVRGLIAQLVYTRITANAPYDQTTQAAIIHEAVELLAERDLGDSAPKLAKPPTAEETKAQLEAEFTRYTDAEGFKHMPWDQFLGIRKMRIAKGTWGYGQAQGVVE